MGSDTNVIDPRQQAMAAIEELWAAIPPGKQNNHHDAFNTAYIYVRDGGPSLPDLPEAPEAPDLPEALKDGLKKKAEDFYPDEEADSAPTTPGDDADEL